MFRQFGGRVAESVARAPVFCRSLRHGFGFRSDGRRGGLPLVRFRASRSFRFRGIFINRNIGFQLLLQDRFDGAWFGGDFGKAEEERFIEHSATHWKDGYCLMFGGALQNYDIKLFDSTGYVRHSAQRR